MNWRRSWSSLGAGAAPAGRKPFRPRARRFPPLCARDLRATHRPDPDDPHLGERPHHYPLPPPAEAHRPAAKAALAPASVAPDTTLALAPRPIQGPGGTGEYSSRYKPKGDPRPASGPRQAAPRGFPFPRLLPPSPAGRPPVEGRLVPSIRQRQPTRRRCFQAPARRPDAPAATPRSPATPVECARMGRGAAVRDPPLLYLTT